MKRKLFLSIVGGLVITLILVASCNFPTVSSVAEEPEAVLPASEQPADSSDSVPPSETEPLEAIDLAGPEMGSTMRWYDDSLLIYIPGGEFVMGKSYDENPQNHPEHPEHMINQSGFWIYRSEVTNGMYAGCVADGGCTSPATDITTDYLNPEKNNHPVVGVDWYQSQAYCSWADGHLPTESQWEKTARGPDGNLYPWGEVDPSCNLLNFDNCVGEKMASGTYLSTTSPIREYFDGASYYEALDMAGNVFEWVQDWYKSDYYQESPSADPPGPPDGDYKTVRSSAFRSTSSLVPSVLRDYFSPVEYRDDLGFRCVIDKPPYYAPVCVYGPPRKTRECPPPTLDVTDTYCKKKTGYAEFTVSEGAIVTSNCIETAPNFYTCSGTPGGFVNVEVCSDCGPTESCPPLQCAPFYTPNSETCECEFDGFIPLGNGEEGIDLDFEGGGSLLCSLVPSLALGPSLGGGECPPGQWWSQKSQMCLPDEPLNCEPPFEDGVPVECMQCPPGTTYNEESGCCEPDEILGPIFSGGTTCESYTLQLGECEDHQNGCTDPSQYSNQNSCESAGCSWSSQYTDAGNCVFP